MAADRYLARTGHGAQQTDRPVAPDCPDNLYQPIGGDHGARGAFDEEAYGRSPQLWATKHRRLLVALSGAGLAGAALTLLLGRKA